MSEHTPTVRWEKPGPGTWTFDGAHSVGPVTRIVQDVFPDAMADGFRSFTERYGLPISHIETRYVNGYTYGAVRIAGAPTSDRPPPPAWVLRVVSRVHPVMRRRNRQAHAALEGRVWHDDLRRWFDELRPARTASLRALQAVDPVALDDERLASHLQHCVAQFAAGLREHFSLVGASGLPVGLYVLQQGERGRSPEEAVAGLAGAAARSTAATLPALAAVADALAEAGVEPSSLDDVRRASPRAAAALHAYLEEYGQRVVTGFDVTGRRLVELPDVVLRSVTAARGRPRLVPAAGAAGADDADGDVVAGDARLAVESRDDHAGISCTWPLGLTRRALLVAGRRLHEVGIIDDPDHVLDATADEVVALLLRGPEAPPAAVLADRATDRRRLASAVPPRVLGDEHAPPDPALFPSGMRRMAIAMNAFLGTLGTRPRDPHAGGDGVGIGRTVHRGRAVVAVLPEDAIARLEPGDVLVTTTTTPAFNSVLPMAGALVTAHGGLMSHAGIAARELGIPAVIGVADVFDRIPDGAMVEVDPVAATVRLAPDAVSPDASLPDASSPEAVSPGLIAFGGGMDSPSPDPHQIGGKAAGLVTMASMGLPVPPGVVLPVTFHRSVTEGGDAVIDGAVRSALAELEVLSGRRLGDPGRPLLVSVRSGSAVSMPGMMDTVLDVGITTEVADALARGTGDRAFADDTHRRFLISYATVVGGLPEDVIARLAESAPTPAALDRELARLGCSVPADPIDQVVEAASAVYRSWDGERATAFRRREGIDDDLGTAVTIQAMVFGNRGPESGTGVVFSRDPSTGARQLVGDVLIAAQGDEVVGGGRPTLPLAEMAARWPVVHRELVGAVAALERHYADVVDVEFTVEQGRLYLLQCRRGRRSPAAALRMAVEMAEDPQFPVDRAEAVARCRDLLSTPPTEVVSAPANEVDERPLVTGLPASPGRGVGALVVSVEDALRRHEAGEDVVLVRPHTAPADVAAMSIANGIVTASGGLVSHAAVVARSWSVPAVVGASALMIDDDGVRIGDRRVAVGDIVTVDGSAGTLLAGSHPGRRNALPEVAVLRRWAAELGGPPSSGGADGRPAPEPSGGAARTQHGARISDVDVLRVVVLRGRADVEGIAAALAAEPDAVTRSAARLQYQGRLAERGSLLSATDAGRARVAANVAASVARHGSAFAVLLERFRRPDAALKALVTDWQVDQGRLRIVPDLGADAERTDAERTDHAAVARRLRTEVHEDALAVIADATILLPRFARYRARLETALDQLDDGALPYLAHPSVDSYHTVWFELHEELIDLAGTDRATETAAGNA